MQKSESIGKLAAALCKFQGDMPKIGKEGKSHHGKYATLPSIIDAIKTPLNEAGLAIAQFPDENETITTILMHAESGEFISASYDIHAARKDPQGVGSAITYARRYALGAVLGLSIDEDDDGNAATAAKQKEDASILKKAIDGLKDCENMAAFEAHGKSLDAATRAHPDFRTAAVKRQQELTNQPAAA